MKIGIYGGTFNPPHLGHVTAARAVFELLKLDRLLLVPDRDCRPTRRCRRAAPRRSSGWR